MQTFLQRFRLGCIVIFVAALISLCSISFRAGDDLAGFFSGTAKVINKIVPEGSIRRKALEKAPYRDAWEYLSGYNDELRKDRQLAYKVFYSIDRDLYRHISTDVHYEYVLVQQFRFSSFKKWVKKVEKQGRINDRTLQFFLDDRMHSIRRGQYIDSHGLLRRAGRFYKDVGLKSGKLLRGEAVEGKSTCLSLAYDRITMGMYTNSSQILNILAWDCQKHINLIESRVQIELFRNQFESRSELEQKIRKNYPKYSILSRTGNDFQIIINFYSSVSSEFEGDWILDEIVSDG